jgi:hypothetical protein
MTLFSQIISFFKNIKTHIQPVDKNTALISKKGMLLNAIVQEDILLAPLIGEACFFAGGCVRDLFTDNAVKDYDIFFKSQDSATTILDRLRLIKDPIQYQFNFESAHTYTITIDDVMFQFCKPPYCGSPSEVLSKFDYTNCMAYFDFSDNSLVTTKEFDHAIEHKQIVFNKNAYNPRVAVDRYARFVDAGWIACDNFEYHELITLSAKSPKRKRSGGGNKRGSFA